MHLLAVLPQAKEITIEILPGYKAGTKITFPSMGDQTRECLCANVPQRTPDGERCHSTASGGKGAFGTPPQRAAAKTAAPQRKAGFLALNQPCLPAGLLPADIAFVVVEKPHDTFKRQGDDLKVARIAPSPSYFGEIVRKGGPTRHITGSRHTLHSHITARSHTL